MSGRHASGYAHFLRRQSSSVVRPLASHYKVASHLDSWGSEADIEMVLGNGDRFLEVFGWMGICWRGLRGGSEDHSLRCIFGLRGGVFCILSVRCLIDL